MLEDRGLVGRTFIGNAAVRRFAVRDLIDLGQVEAAQDHNIFRTPEGQSHSFRQLDFGKIILSPERLDGTGRPDRYQWCVKE